MRARFTSPRQNRFWNDAPCSKFLARALKFRGKARWAEQESVASDVTGTRARAVRIMGRTDGGCGDGAGKIFELPASDLRCRRCHIADKRLPRRKNFLRQGC